MPAIRDPHKMFAACLNFYRSNPQGGEKVRKSAIYGHVAEALRHYLSGLAEMHEGAYPGWKADADNPGCMIRIDPPVVMRAPYHLVCAFPSETVLDAIWHLSRQVKTLPTSVLCLSGSAAIMKSSVTVSDIDFCEYVSGGPGQVGDALAGKLGDVRDLMLRRVRVGNANIDRVCDVADIKARVSAIKPSDPDLSHAKVDFIGKPEGMRPTDVSNVIIFCDENWRSASMSRSFAAQEAHLDPVVAVPNTLCEPYELGRYVDFLLGQATSYIEKGDYPKSLKRCLSLARLCFLSTQAEEITNFIRRSTEFIGREIASIDELVSDIKASGLALGHWCEDLTWARQDLDHDLVKAKRTPPAISIERLSRRTVATLGDALAGRDLKAA